MTDVNEVLSSLGELSQADLKKVGKMASFLLSRSPEEVSWAEAAWSQLVEHAQDRGIVLPKHVKNVGKYQDFCTNADRAVEYMVKACGPSDKTGTYSYLRMVARAVIARCVQLRNDLGLPISPGTVMQQYASFEAAMGAQWPGGDQELQFVLSSRASAR